MYYNFLWNNPPWQLSWKMLLHIFLISNLYYKNYFSCFYNQSKLYLVTALGTLLALGLDLWLSTKLKLWLSLILGIFVLFAILALLLYYAWHHYRRGTSPLSISLLSTFYARGNILIKKSLHISNVNIVSDKMSCKNNRSIVLVDKCL